MTMAAGDFAVILAAAGQSTRFGAGTNKVLQLLAGQTVLARTVAAFLCRPDATMVIIATADPAGIATALGDESRDVRVRIVPGGSCRAASVQAALSHVPAEIEWVAIHDGARPLISQALIDRTLLAARAHGAAAPALPVPLTIKQATAPLPARVERTVPRANLWAMQTPQIVRRQVLLDAFDACALPLEQVTDDLQLLELAGVQTWLVQGEERNLKITTPTDLMIAEQVL